MISTSVDDLVHEQNYLENDNYIRYLKPGDPDLIHLEGVILEISMYRGMPFLLKNDIRMDKKETYETVFMRVDEYITEK